MTTQESGTVGKQGAADMFVDMHPRYITLRYITRYYAQVCPGDSYVMYPETCCAEYLGITFM